MNVYAAEGQDGLGDNVPFITFGADGLLYVANDRADNVLRFKDGSLAAFTISLSSAAESQVTVDYTTGDGTATEAGDYVQGSGTLTFAPGQTKQVISIQTVDNVAEEQIETFTIILSNPTGAEIADGTGIATIRDDDAKFYVVNDAAADSTFRYDGVGSSGASSALVNGNTAPRGAASTAAGDLVWAVDANKTVYVYDAGGTLLGSWAVGSLPQNAQVHGIATDGTNIWIVDAAQDKVYRYTNAASRLSGSQNAASSFSLNKSNKNPKDIVTDGTHMWVVDDSTTDKVFKYTLSGSLVGSWTISAGGGSPTGITLDLANNSDLWIVDSATDRVYQYVGAASRTSGSQSAATSFPLAAGNTNPQGIADPPTGASASHFAADSPQKLDARATVALARSLAAAAYASPSKEASGAGQASATGDAPGNSMVFSPIAAAPSSAVPFTQAPGNTQASASLSAIEDVMAEFGDSVTGKHLRGLALALDTTLEGLFTAT
jgi:hypothetical protein